MIIISHVEPYYTYREYVSNKLREENCFASLVFLAIRRILERQKPHASMQDCGRFVSQPSSALRVSKMHTQFCGSKPPDSHRDQQRRKHQELPFNFRTWLDFLLYSANSKIVYKTLRLRTYTYFLTHSQLSYLHSKSAFRS